MVVILHLQHGYLHTSLHLHLEVFCKGPVYSVQYIFIHLHYLGLFQKNLIFEIRCSIGSEFTDFRRIYHIWFKKRLFSGSNLQILHRALFQRNLILIYLFFQHLLKMGLILMKLLKCCRY